MQIFLDQIELSCACAAEKRSARHKINRSEASTIQPPIAMQPTWRRAASKRSNRRNCGFRRSRHPPDFVPTHSKTRALTVKVNGDPPALAQEMVVVRPIHSARAGQLSKEEIWTHRDSQLSPVDPPDGGDRYAQAWESRSPSADRV